jgi:hypothetical protein
MERLTRGRTVRRRRNCGFNGLLGLQVISKRRRKVMEASPLECEKWEGIFPEAGEVQVGESVKLFIMNGL